MLLGVMGNAASLMAFLAALFQPTIISNQPNIQSYRIFLALAVVSVILGAFGRRVPRVLVVLNGVTLAFLWLNLGASSL